MRIDTQDPIGTSDSDGGSADGTSRPPADQAKLTAALDHLHTTALTKDIEPICQAYAHLRRIAPELAGRELLLLADQHLGFAVARLVISAFSHRRCYMCADGTVPCDWCEGAGADGRGRPCNQCDGLGLTVCGFCGGTGWADRGTIPPELAVAVAKKHLAHVQSDLKRLQHSVADLGRDALDHMSPDRRGALAGRLVRIRARLVELSTCKACKNGHTAHLAELAQRVGILLHALRR